MVPQLTVSKRNGMPTLNWIGKEAVLNHHRVMPYHLLRCDEKLSVGDPGSGNLLVQGDKRPDGGNVLTSRILNELPAHEGRGWSTARVVVSAQPA